MKFITGLLAALTLGVSAPSWAENYVIDTKGSHAFIQFKVAHLGYSWLLGRFDEFDGKFSYDTNSPSSSKIDIIIKTASVDTNHAERDKHLRSDDFLQVKRFPEARFVSTGFKDLGDGKATLEGNFTLLGVTRPISINVTNVGNGKDPWGGYRRGFEGSTKIKMKDYNIKMDLGPASAEVELYFSFEGIRV